MGELLVITDEEAAAIAELNEAMDIRWATRLPSTRPEEFGRIVGTGGTETSLVTDDALITIEGFAKSEVQAKRITALAVAHLQAAGRDGAIGGVTCYRVTLVGRPANVPLPSVNDRFRYIATVSASLRRETV